MQQQLSTPSGFAAAVQPKNSLFRSAIACFVVAAICLGFNIFQLGSSFAWDFEWMMMHFFDLASDGTRARAAGFRWFVVWAPIVAIPLGIVLLALHFAKRKGSGEAMFNNFQQRGWIGRQVPLNLEIQNGNARVALALMGPADGQPGELEHQAAQYGQWLATLDKKTLKQTAAAAAKAGALGGVSAQEIAPAFTPGTAIVPVDAKAALFAVIPPASGPKGYTVLRIKQA